MPPTSCSSCGSSEIETVDFNGHSQVVCTSCGQVFEQGSFYENEDPTEGTFNYCPPSGPITAVHGSKIRTHLRAGNIDKNSQNLSITALNWVKYTERRARVLGLSSSLTKQATELFENAFNHPTFHRRTIIRKQALIGACLFVICRQNKWSILITNVASCVESTVSDVNAMFTLLVKEFNLEVPILMDMDQLVPSILNIHGIFDKAVHAKTISICSIATDTWLACGRHHEPVILVAAYLAQKSLGNAKLLFSEFLRGLKSRPSVIRLRLHELTNVILTLAKKIPWISKKHLNAKSVHFILDDVLENQKMLIAKCCEDDNGEQDSSSVNCLIPPSHKEAKVNATADNSDDNVSENSALHDLASSETLCELDIPESELHRYIRSPEEVAEIEKIKVELESEEEAGENDEDTVNETNPSVIGESASDIQISYQSTEAIQEVGAIEKQLDKQVKSPGRNLPNKHTTRKRSAPDKSKEQYNDDKDIERPPGGRPKKLARKGKSRRVPNINTARKRSAPEKSTEQYNDDKDIERPPGGRPKKLARKGNSRHVPNINTARKRSAPEKSKEQYNDDKDIESPPGGRPKKLARKGNSRHVPNINTARKRSAPEKSKEQYNDDKDIERPPGGRPKKLARKGKSRHVPNIHTARKRSAPEKSKEQCNDEKDIERPPGEGQRNLLGKGRVDMYQIFIPQENAVLLKKVKNITLMKN
ncbi:transcription factor IIIB 50 kDa subunit-like [Amphiura filiformis]|uniref:transcription factor IIIB 50 kDa subunit-like n=1 Tax=Amphiura filiformis TaxID=82378 RepID=UPI003B20E802